jgi:hypothetical protein
MLMPSSPRHSLMPRKVPGTLSSVTDICFTIYFPRQELLLHLFFLPVIARLDRAIQPSGSSGQAV